MEKQTQERPARDRHETLTASQGARKLLNAPPEYLTSISLDERAVDAAAVSDPMREVIRTLVKQLFDDVVLPTLAAQTREELFRALNARWNRYRDTMSALVVLFSTTPAGLALTKRANNEGHDLATEAAKIAGQKAADEVTFADETYQSAVRITSRFSGLMEPRDLDQDRQLAGRFNHGSTLRSLGQCMIGAIAGGNRATQVGIDAAFELYRAGAMDAYIAARLALSLREPVEPECDEPLAFDEDDVALANG